MLRQYELENENPVKGRFGPTHLRNIHKYIFQDVYSFAGKYRVEDIWKDKTFFCKSEYIKENLSYCLANLIKENYLRNLPLKESSARIAYYMAEINMIHPFREGNGQAIREFIRQLALYAGYRIDWSKVEPDILLEASIISVDKDMEPLTECIIKAIVKL
ncbi:cell filamentation protein fic [hydrocarbon metagenome]|uniref:Cell filamentation protein fic n=1 Tax=hydrocarbon metagenome TaxID=938273 RepID=A0A0W8E6J6_9ZZZZ